MTNRVFRMINRFFEGTGDVIGTPSGDARGHINRPDFMQHDLTGSSRRYHDGR